jgi:hypothetical protein
MNAHQLTQTTSFSYLLIWDQFALYRRALELSTSWLSLFGCFVAWIIAMAKDAVLLLGLRLVRVIGHCQKINKILFQAKTEER